MTFEQVKKEIVQIIEVGILVPHTQGDGKVIHETKSTRDASRIQSLASSSSVSEWSSRNKRENTYLRFKNENLRVVAYDMIPASVREKIHRRVADELAGR